MNKVAKGIVVVLVGWILLMFLLSSQNGWETAQTSQGMAYYIAKVVFHTTDSLVVQWINAILRKAAHVVLYFILGILLGVAADNVAKGIPVGVRYVVSYLFLMFCCFFDEWHKQFIMGRHNDLRDVKLNVIGGTVGLLLTVLIQVVLSEKNK